MNRLEILKILDDNKEQNVKWFQKHYPDIISSIKSYCEWYSNTTDISLSMMFHIFYYGITDFPKCKTCNTPITKTNRNDKTGKPFMKEQFNMFCSAECLSKNENIKNKKVETLIKNYGVDNPNRSETIKKRIKDTNLERYGVENVSSAKEIKRKRIDTFNTKYGTWVSKAKTVKDKIKQTNNEKYGYDSVLESPDIQKKIKQTNNQRYGVDNPLLNKDIRQKAQDSFINRSEHDKQKTKEKKTTKSLDVYGCRHPNQKHLHSDIKLALSSKTEFEKLLECFDNNIIQICLEYDLYPNILYKNAKTFGIPIRSNESYLEASLAKFLDTLNIQYERGNRKILNGKELDFFIKDKNIGIEINGLYWHSTENLDKNYHQQKSLSCMDNGIQLIHVWEDDWVDDNKRTIIENKIKSKLGLLSNKVYARQCDVIETTSKEVSEFYKKTHIQGAIKANINICLYHDGEIVAAMSFKKIKDQVYDLVRFSTSKRVIGGFSKLLTYFKRKTPCEEIITFAHLDYSHGNVYEQNGFKMSYITPPNYFYTYKGIGPRIRREKFMKHKLPHILENFDPSLTEKENMLNHGYYQIYDSGSIKYKLTIKAP